MRDRKLFDSSYASINHTHDTLPPSGHGAVYTRATRQILSGAGLIGGGDLTSDRTLAVGAGTGIVVNADDVALSPATIASLVLADTSVQPADLSAYSLATHDHDADYAAISHTHDDRYYTEIEVDTLLTGYSLTTHDHDAAYAPIGVTLTAGAGLTGGGDISVNRTFTVGAGTGIAVNADDVALSAATIASLALADSAIQVGSAPTWTGQHTFATGAIIFKAQSDAATLTAFSSFRNLSGIEIGWFGFGLGSSHIFSFTNTVADAAMQARTNGGIFSIINSNVENARFDADGTAGNTRFMIYDVDNATLERVSVGAADTGGSGFKVLRIPN
jgi:hypothetical protein